MLDQDIAMVLAKAQEAWLQVNDLVRSHLNGAEITSLQREDGRIRGDDL